MNISSIISVAVSVRNRTPSLLAFGVPLILAYTTVGASGGLVRSYRDLDAVYSDGHALNSAVYRAAKAIFAQSPRPPVVKVGRRPTATTQQIDFLATNTTVGKKYYIVVESNGTEYTAEYTVITDDDATDIATGLKAALDALSIPNLTTAISSTKLRCTCGLAGGLLRYTRVSPYLTVAETSTVGTLLDDYAAVILQDPAFYCVVVADNHNESAISAMCGIVETQERIFVTDTFDSECVDPGDSDDIFSTAKGQLYSHSYIQHSKNIAEFAALALASTRLAAPPGSDTWAFKALRGITPSEYNATEQGALEAKNGNFYTTVAGLPNTFWGKTPSGEYMDVTRGLHALVASIQGNVYTLLSNSPKVPFTNVGIALVKGEVRSALKKHSQEPYNFLDPGTLVVTAPDVSAVTPEDKAARNLEGITFGGTIQGAIHTTGVTGNLSQ